MESKVITSLNNEKIKFYQKLQHKKYRDQEKLFLVEDEHLVNEALKKGVVQEIITVNEEAKYEVPIILVTEKIMKLISTQMTSAKVIALCRQMVPRNCQGNVIILDNLQDPGNLGTIIRSAVAFNFDTIVLSEKCVDLYNPKVVRSSEGMLFHLNIIRTDISKFLQNLDSTYVKITTDVQAGCDIKNIKFQNCALIIGNEGSGVSSEVASLCDQKVYIKMNKNCESLNAAVCASILMYEVNDE